jgi:hypothetical protein
MCRESLEASNLSEHAEALSSRIGLKILRYPKDAYFSEASQGRCEAA